MTYKSSPTGEHCKITFRMEQDEDGWPPQTVETLWAKPAAKECQAAHKPSH